MVSSLDFSGAKTKAVESKSFRDLINQNGLLAKKLLSSNEVVRVYSASEHADFTSATIRVSNLNASDVEVTIWVSYLNSPEDIDVIEPLLVLKNHAVYVGSEFIIGKGETLYVKSNSDRVVVRLEGFENRPLR